MSGVTGASLVVSNFAIFRLVFAPASGTLIDRLGELRVFCGGLLIVGLSSGACAFAEDFTQLLVLRSLGGIGSTMFTVSAAALLLRVSPPTMRGRAAGAWATGFLIGCAAGPAVGGWLIEVNPRAPFLIYAGVLVVVAAGLAALGDRALATFLRGKQTIVVPGDDSGAAAVAVAVAGPGDLLAAELAAAYERARPQSR